MLLIREVLFPVEVSRFRADCLVEACDFNVRVPVALWEMSVRLSAGAGTLHSSRQIGRSCTLAEQEIPFWPYKRWTGRALTQVSNFDKNSSRDAVLAPIVGSRLFLVLAASAVLVIGKRSKRPMNAERASRRCGRDEVTCLSKIACSVNCNFRK